MLTLRFSSAVRAGGLALLLAACGDNGGTSGSAGLTDSGGASSSGAGSSSTNPSGTVSDSATSEPGSGTGSMTSQTATEPTGTASATSGSSTTDPGTSTATTTEPGTTGGSTGAVSTDTGGSTTDTTGAVSGSTSDGGSTGGGSTGPDCTPVAEVCNDLDDDCNGIVDDVDVGGDGICDCLNIAIFGNKGANPSAQFEAWLEAQGTQVDRIQTDNTPLSKAILDKYDIVILDWLVRNYTAQEAALVADWVGTGGGLMSMTGHVNNNTVVDRPNSIIKPMGLSYNASKGFFSGPVTQWLKPHPITDGITSVSFYGGLYIDIVDDGLGINTVIGTLPQGPVAVAQERKAGKLFIFGDEWIEFDSEWQQIPQIKKLWANVLGWLSPQNFCTIPQ